MPDETIARCRCWGLVKRKECWTFSLRGWLVLAVGVLSAGAWLVLVVQPFLAVTQRVPTDVMVVEGWISESAIRVAVTEFGAGAYQRVFTTGGPLRGTGLDGLEERSLAQIGARRLQAAGLAAEVIQAVPSQVRERDRTYSAALALGVWLRQHHLPVRAVNVVTEGAHARRTRLLFEKALGAGIQVGVLAAPNPEYDAAHWWHYSEGVREVIGETIAYVYARFFFHPSHAAAS